jgi:hypothetical protein
MECARIVRWRRSYLDNIAKYRAENRQIYYLDETWSTTRTTRRKKGGLMAQTTAESQLWLQGKELGW